MTEGQFYRAVEINKRIIDLEKVKSEIDPKSEHRLYYVSTGRSERHLCPEWIMRCICDILDKHDLMIREEIDAEITKLANEIKEL